MRLVLVGTGTFAVPALEALAPHVILAVAQPGRPSGRGLKVRPSAVEARAAELGIPVETPQKARDPEFVARIEALRPDALVVASYGQILSQRLLDSAIRGGINLHGSLLPRWRGAAPIQRAIEAGDPETGVTLMQMDRGMDTGGMIATVATPIQDEESYGELQDRLAIIAAEMAAEWMPRIVAGEYSALPQPEEGITLAPKLSKEEGVLDVSLSATVLARRVRAFTPSPGATLTTTRGVLRVHRATAVEGDGEPGVVLGLRPLVVACGEGALQLDLIQPEGKPRVGGSDWANGARLVPGTPL